MNSTKKFNSRKFKYGSFATLITVLIIAVILIINIIATIITTKYPLNIDLTKNNFFGISDEAKEYVENLQKDINIYVLADETSLTSGANLYLTQANETFRSFAKLSPRISLQYIDLVKDPTFTANYPDLSLQNGNILIECGGKTKVLVLYDLFNVTQNEYGAYVTSSKAEETLIQAFLNVSAEETYQAVFITGHGEERLEPAINMLSQNNYTMQEIILATADIPEETDVVFIMGPTTDYTEEELKKLDTYLDNNGEYGKNLFYAASPSQPESMPNLDAFLAEWGIKVEPGVVYETDSMRMYSNPYFAVASYSESVLSESFVNKNMVTILPLSRPLSLTFSEQGNRTAQALLAFLQSAGVSPVDAADDFDAAAGVKGTAFPGMIMGTMAGQGADAASSHVVAIGSTAFFNETFLNNTSFANGEYFMEVINTATDRQDVVKIVAKEASVETLSLNFMQAIILMVLTAILPLAVIIIGVVVWLRRRHL